MTWLLNPCVACTYVTSLKLEVRLTCWKWRHCLAVMPVPLHYASSLLDNPHSILTVNPDADAYTNKNRDFQLYSSVWTRKQSTKWSALANSTVPLCVLYCVKTSDSTLSGLFYSFSPYVRDLKTETSQISAWFTEEIAFWWFITKLHKIQHHSILDSEWNCFKLHAKKVAKENTQRN